jgi:hypothetical protein|tara:strand:+ start:1040 stop:1222 length:183 start_codon:yes stop_codon:yes gene_type:complete
MDVSDINTCKYFKDAISNNQNIMVTTNDGRLFWVPIDNANTDYKAVLTWVDAGNTITAAD